MLLLGAGRGAWLFCSACVPPPNAPPRCRGPGSLGTGVQSPEGPSPLLPGPPLLWDRERPSPLQVQPNPGAPGAPGGAGAASAGSSGRGCFSRSPLCYLWVLNLPKLQKLKVFYNLFWLLNVT